MPIDMHIYAAGFGKQFFHQHQSRVHILQIRHRSFLPKVGIAELLKGGRLLCNLIVRQAYLCAVIRLAIEWRVDVNKVYLSSQRFQTAAFIACKQCLHGKEIISINKTIVFPAFHFLRVHSPPKTALVLAG